MSLARPKYTTEQCDMLWGNVRCADELDHVANDNGGLHAFDLSHLGVRRPVLVAANARGLRRVEK